MRRLNTMKAEPREMTREDLEVQGWLGSFHRIEDAVEARRLAEEELFTHGETRRESKKCHN